MAEAYDDESISDDSELEFHFHSEGPQPYNFEPAARGISQGANYERLSGVREEIESWARDNVDRVGNIDW